MRIATRAVISLTMAVCPASASEVFIAQSTNKAVSAEQAAASSVKTIQSAAMLAFPMQLKAVNSPIVANATTDTSALVQIGTNNVAAVSQTGSGNASSVVQRGSGIRRR
jgi:Curlin associated repeat